MQDICRKDMSLISVMVSFMDVNLFYQVKAWGLNKLGIWHDYLTVIKVGGKGSHRGKFQLMWF